MHMKKIYLIVLTIIMLLIVPGCSNDTASDAPDMNYERIDCGFLISDEYTESCIYSNGDQMIFSIEKFLKVNAGPATSTDAFVLVDIETEAAKKIIPVGLSAQVNSAVPYMDGVMYVDYETGDDNLIHWEIIKHTAGEKKTLLSGKCDVEYKLPSLELLNNTPVVLWEDAESGMTRLSKIVKEKFEDVITDDENIQMVTSDISANTKEVCFAAKTEWETAEMIIADLEGIVSSLTLEHKLTSFALTKDHLLCGVGDVEEKGIFSLLNYDFRLENVNITAILHPLYRMSGSNTETALCVDDSFMIKKVNASDSSISDVNAPLGKTGKPVSFSSIIDGKCIASILEKNKNEYYVLSM